MLSKVIKAAERWLSHSDAEELARNVVQGWLLELPYIVQTRGTDAHVEARRMAERMIVRRVKHFGLRIGPHQERRRLSRCLAYDLAQCYGGNL